MSASWVDHQVVWQSADTFYLFEPEVALTVLNDGGAEQQDTHTIPVVISGTVDRKRNVLTLQLSVSVAGHHLSVSSALSSSVTPDLPAVTRCSKAGQTVLAVNASPATVVRWYSASPLGANRYEVGPLIGEGLRLSRAHEQALWLTATRNRFTTYSFVESNQEMVPPCE